ncbi:MAG: hypothetical protein HCA25_14565 [Dolichospermum sp. DET50]|nr:hypothetical protein [Dolichospermum sp. DET66]MBS3033462.1 hypothetical protein [Dolichospermum sp. DET67]MBS3038666.1 hypothetical protein [Dolichospermum sp. DET50]QSX65943.1 MAG: hypothetical protein EZY12_13815 [Dolichospermum sp. DET69]
MKALTTVLPARLLKKNIKVRSQESGVRRNKEEEEGGRILPITHYLLPITYYLLPITYYLLPITYYLLPITYYLLPITYYLLPITYYLLPITKIDISYNLHNAPSSFYPD